MAFDKNRYDADYKRANYDHIQIMVPKGCRDDIKAEASRRGMSVSQLIIRALEAQYGLDLIK